MRSTPKLELNYHDRLDKMWFITKNRWDNDVIDRTSVNSVEYDTELSRLIGQCVVYDEDETGQRRYRSYRFTLR